MKHPFQPINSKERFEEALDYVAATAAGLSEAVLSEALPIDTVTLFTRTSKEYYFLERLVRTYGERSEITHGPTLYIDSNFMLGENVIRYLGVRRPDDTRPEVGYADFPVEDFEGLREAHAGNEAVKFMKSGRGQPLLELRHPEFDIRGYVVSAADH